MLPLGALYCLSARSFMIRVGGQSGTAMWRTMSSAPAGVGGAPAATRARTATTIRARAMRQRILMFVASLWA